MSTKILTVITPVLNDIDGLKKTRSHFHLDDEHVEHIIVDGNSIDGSREFAKYLEEKYTNVHLIDQYSYGIYGAFNDGISNASGKYIIFNHCGDLLNIELVLKNIKKNDNFCILACSATQDKRSTIKSHIRSQTGKLKITSTSIIQPALIIKKSTYEQLQGYNNYYHISADVDLIVRAIKNAIEIKYSDDLIVHMEEFSLSRIHLYKKIREHYLIKLNHVGFYHANHYLISRLVKELLVYPIWRKIKMLT